MGSNRNSFLLSCAFFSFIFFTILLPTSIFSQELKSSEGGTVDRIEGDIKFLPTPYISYNRSFGYQLGAAPVIMFNPVKSDTLSPSSMAGIAAIYSENKTWFLMGFSMLYLDEDNWRITAVGGLGTLNFQFFLDSPVNSWIPYNTKIDLIFLQAQRRIIKKLYAGISLIHIRSKTTTESPPLESNTELNGLGLQLSIDQRSNTRYPINGYKTSIKYFTYPKFLDNEKASSKIELDFNYYSSFRERKDVLASRVFVGLGLGDLDFNQQLIVGRKDIRGYTQGAFRGNYLIAVQSEYRWNFLKRFGIVGFAGVATVFEAINENDNGKFLPGIGFGFRYTVETETRMNAGMDIAAGVDDWGIYFRIGEAF